MNQSEIIPESWDIEDHVSSVVTEANDAGWSVRVPRRTILTRRFLHGGGIYDFVTDTAYLSIIFSSLKYDSDVEDLKRVLHAEFEHADQRVAMFGELSSQERSALEELGQYTEVYRERVGDHELANRLFYQGWDSGFGDDYVAYDNLPVLLAVRHAVETGDDAFIDRLATIHNIAEADWETCDAGHSDAERIQNYTQALTTEADTYLQDVPLSQHDDRLLKIASVDEEEFQPLIEAYDLFSRIAPQLRYDDDGYLTDDSLAAITSEADILRAVDMYRYGDEILDEFSQVLEAHGRMTQVYRQRSNSNSQKSATEDVYAHSRERMKTFGQNLLSK